MKAAVFCRNMGMSGTCSMVMTAAARSAAVLMSWVTSSRWETICISGCLLKLCLLRLRGMPVGTRPLTPGLESDDQADGGDDAPEDLERRLKRDVGDDDAGEDGGNRKGPVGDDVEGGHHRRAMLGRDLGDECAEGAEEGGAEADPAEDRPGEVGRARVRRRRDDDQDGSSREPDGSRARGEPGCAASGEELGDEGGRREGDDAAPRDDCVARV